MRLMQEAVVDTIVAKVQGVPGDDRCVLMLGYPDQMEAMMWEANPGLARRFQLSQAWTFEDYGKEDLLAEHLAAMFPEEGPPAPWDQEAFEFRCTRLEVYFQVG